MQAPETCMAIPRKMADVNSRSLGSKRLEILTSPSDLSCFDQPFTYTTSSRQQQASNQNRTSIKMSGRPSNASWCSTFLPSSTFSHSYTANSSSGLSTPTTSQGFPTPASTQGHTSPNSTEVPWSSTQLPEISSHGACQTGQYGTGRYGLHKTVSSGTDPKVCCRAYTSHDR